MKILIVSENFYPDIFAINDIVCSLINRGHKVAVLISLPIKKADIEERLNNRSNNMIELDNKRTNKISE